MDAEATFIVQSLGLVAHPEGGFYRETFRAPTRVATPRGERSASTAILYLLPAGALSALHRVAADEVWHHYDGDPVELHVIDDAGAHEVHLLGHEVARGERPQVVVPAGAWQAALAVGGRHALCGCTVSPGFDFADFEMPTRAALLSRFPSLHDTIVRLTRP
jgi:predicted cupin superfamily sugar epimerase